MTTEKKITIATVVACFLLSLGTLWGIHQFAKACGQIDFRRAIVDTGKEIKQISKEINAE